MTELKTLEIETGPTPSGSVIWLHGLGASGHDFEPIVPLLRIPNGLHLRFVFPHAPAIPVTINAGYVMPAWYDILEMNLDRRIDEAQLRASAQAVGKVIERENARGIPSGRIVVAGFSQGGAVGFELALCWPERLAGLLALSTYFATRRSIAPNAANAQMPIAIHHGLQDPVVSESHGREAAELLTDWGYPVEYRTWPMEHAVAPAQIRDIGLWLAARMEQPA
ncbi:MAG: carboxylesterase [Gammaproteobacteria bacterium]|nr:carboxylesterase [Gammaproteobacteria bacterium]